MRSRAPFISLRTEGSLLPPDILQRVAAGDPKLAGLAPESYHLDPHAKLGEAISRSWARLVGVWRAFRERLDALPPSDLATGLTRDRWLLPLFQELGYGRVQPTRALEVDGRTNPVSHLAMDRGSSFGFPPASSRIGASGTSRVSRKRNVTERSVRFDLHAGVD